MTLSIQRPPGAADALFHRFEHPQPPLNSQLTIAADECVVVVHNGVVLGIAPPGMHWLHPQPFPFLIPAIVGDNAVQAELWFVKTAPVTGIQFGGALPAVVEPGTTVKCICRTFGDFALTVRDPARFVTSCVGSALTDPEPVLGWVKGLVMRQFAGAFAKEVEGGKSVQSRDLVPAVLDRIAGELGELDGMGFAVPNFGNATVTVSEDDMAALRDAKVQAAMAKGMPPARAATLKCSRCSKPHDAGRFCVDCGGALATG